MVSTFHVLLVADSFPSAQNTTTAGIVFEDFNTAFVNKFYHSHLDDLCE